MDWRLQSGALADPLFFFFFLFIIFVSLGGHPPTPSPPDKSLPLVFSVAKGRGRDCCSFFTCTEAHCLILKLSCITCWHLLCLYKDLFFCSLQNEFSVSVLKPLLAQNIQPCVWTSEAFPSTYPVSGAQAPQVCLGSVSSSCFYSSYIGNDDTSVCPHYYT